MDSRTARQLVMREAELRKLNYSWIAEQTGRSRQLVRQWIMGLNEPSEDAVWIQMARILGLEGRADITLKAMELSLEVLVKSEDPDLRRMAASLVRELTATRTESQVQTSRDIRAKVALVDRLLSENRFRDIGSACKEADISRSSYYRLKSLDPVDSIQNGDPC